MGEGCDPPADGWPPGLRPPCPPPSAVRRQREGTRGPPPPPPPPTQAQERTEADRRNGSPAPPPKGPRHPGCGGTTAEAGARTPCPLPADGGLAAPRTAQTERPYQRPARGRRGHELGRGDPPPLPPPQPAALTRWRPTGPHPMPAPARQPPGHEYTPGGHAGDNGWQADARRGGGAGGRPPQPPPRPPPSLGATGATLRLPGGEGAPPLPQKGPRRGGDGLRLDQPPAPAGVVAEGRAHTSVPEQRADQAWGRRTAAHQNSMEAAPAIDPPITTAHSGRAEGGFRSAGAPGGAVHGTPLIPPRPGAAPRPGTHAHAGGECADRTRGARMGYRGPPPRGGAGRPRRDPPPHPPPTGPQAAGAPAPTP